jgi:hypothetical protein
MALGALSVLLAGPGLAETSGTTAAAGGESAVWTPKEIEFVYIGFTSTYSCDGLQERVRQLLLELGARADVQVQQYGCTAVGTPEPFPGVRIKMNVLQPTAAHEAGGNSQPVAAQWKSVVIAPKFDPASASGDCELIEQFKHYVLPAFTTRNVEFKATCIPHQLTVGGVHLSADVLVADKPAAAAASGSS